MDWRSMFFFKAMLTPKIITIAYWLLLFAVLGAGIGQCSLNT